MANIHISIVNITIDLLANLSVATFRLIKHLLITSQV